MIRRFSGLHLGLLLGGLVTVAAVGCGGDDENNGPTANAGGGGKAGSTSGKGGKGGSGDAGEPGTDTGGDPGTDGGGSTGSGGAPPVATGDIDEVLKAICDWEFRCCDEGEIRYRLNPTASDAANCLADFQFQLHESNTTSNPFASGSAVGLLGRLGYQVDLERVEVNADAVADCVAQWEEMDCNSALEPDARCDAAGGTDPCALTSLFSPTLELDEQCNPDLAEGLSGGNDVECLPGSTCLEEGHDDNDNSFAACVKRGVADEPCTVDADCDFDFFCNDDGNCAEKAAAGDDCSFEDPDQPALGEEAIQCKAGLMCHPTELTCTEPCTLGFRCTADGECPEDTSCVPINVENDTVSFRVCAGPGNAATARCDSDVDCVPTRYCHPVDKVCLPDVAQNVACTTTAACPEGMHCNAITGCTTNLLPNANCAVLGTATDACGPAPARCAAGTCSSGPVDNTDPCDEDADCSSGLCDYATTVAIALTCIPGVASGDDCEPVVAAATEPRCAPGLYCSLAGTCAMQAGPGGDCEDPDTSLANPLICANGGCVTEWEELMCTDAAVPVSAGGTNVTCDGN